MKIVFYSGDLIECLRESVEDIYNSKNVSSLHIASGKGDLGKIERLIKRGVDVNIRSEKDFTPLFFAIYKNQIPAVNLLISCGADVNVTSSDGHTPFNFAVLQGNLEILKILIINGSDIFTKTLSLETALHLAAYFGYYDVVKFLVDNKLPLNLKNAEGASALHLACTHSNVEIVKYLIENGCDVHDNYLLELVPPLKAVYITPIMCAIQRGQIEIIKVLLSAGALANNSGINNQFGFNALHLACQVGHKAAIDLLCDSGVNVNALTCKRFKITALHFAVRCNHVAVVRRLLSIDGINVDVKDMQDFTALHYASLSGNLEMVKILVNHKADVTARINSIITDLWNFCGLEGFLDNHSLFCGAGPVHLALLQHNFEVAEFLIKNGAEVNVQSVAGVTPLHLTIHEGSDKRSLNFMKVLIENGADVNIRVQSGDTALHLATLQDLREIVACLLQNKADVNALNKNKLTPLHSAISPDNLDIVSLLIEAGANVNAKSDDNSTPLHLAAMMGEIDIVKLLVRKGAHVNVSDSLLRTPVHFASEMCGPLRFLLEHGAHVNDRDLMDKSSPIHLAVENGNLDEIKMLIDYGADVNIKRKKDMTPLHLAAENGELDIVNLLLLNGAYYDSLACPPKNLKPVDFANTNFSIRSLLTSLGYMFEAVQKKKYVRVNNIIDKLQELINVKNVSGRTLLHYAADSGEIGLVSLLLSHGADPCSITIKGNTPLLMAVSKGYVDIAEMLLQHVDSDKLSDHVNTQTTGTGTTPLHVASMNGSLVLVMALLDKGAIYNIKNKCGVTPLELAKRSNHNNVISLLETIYKLFNMAANGDVECLNILNSFDEEKFSCVTQAQNLEKCSILQLAVACKHYTLAQEIMHALGCK